MKEQVSFLSVNLTDGFLLSLKILSKVKQEVDQTAFPLTCPEQQHLSVPPPPLSGAPILFSEHRHVHLPPPLPSSWSLQQERTHSDLWPRHTQPETWNLLTSFIYIWPDKSLLMWKAESDLIIRLDLIIETWIEIIFCIIWYIKLSYGVIQCKWSCYES